MNVTHIPWASQNFHSNVNMGERCSSVEGVLVYSKLWCLHLLWQSHGFWWSLDWAGLSSSEPPKTESGGWERWAWKPSAAPLPAGSAFVSQHCHCACMVSHWVVDCSPLGSSVHGILRARMLEWVAMPPTRGSPHPLPHTHPFLRKATPPGFSFQ